jgi:hypothetical protein
LSEVVADWTDIFSIGVPSGNRATFAAIRSREGEMTPVERAIATLVERKNALPNGNPERRLLERELIGLRCPYEEAGGVIEDLNPEWGSICRPLASSPATESRQACPSVERFLVAGETQNNKFELVNCAP